MDNNLNEVMKACIGACLPCIALTTTETNEIINRTVEFAVKHESRAVYVWRESIGFQEYAAYITEEDGSQRQMMSMDKIATEFDVKVVPGKRAELTPDDDFPGATIPFAIEFIGDYNGDTEGRGAIFILRDWHRYVNANADHVDKQLAMFEALSENPDKLVIALAPVAWDTETTPIELDQYMYRAGFDMPNKADRLASARHWHSSITGERGDEFPLMLALDEADLEAVADATGGLTHKQVEDVLCMSISTRNTYDLDFILGEKQYLVKQAGFEIQRPTHGFKRIGGLTPLKTWAGRLRKRFSQAAFEYGFLGYPRGLLMAGVPGCGKSAIAKAIAHEWGMNLLTVQATDLKGSLVGESEAKVSRLLRVASAAAPIIVFIDEAEKLLGKSEGINDGGAHDAILGQFLSFMQEDRTGVFFVFTANNMEKFAPELVDRFEGRFFIDLPSATERKEILKIHLTLRGWDIEEFKMDKLVTASKDFSGRNIEDAINEAMGNAFSEDRTLSNADLLDVFSEVIPTSKTKKTEIETMRTFVENGMMRSANDRTDEEQSSKGGKQLRSFA
jgi:ATP-dependent 26S proteasome regulatory subunit